MLQQSAVIIEILLLGLGILETANQDRMSAYGYFGNDSEKCIALHAVNVRQEIETYMEEFASMYTSEACGGKQKIFVQSKDVYADDFESPIKLTVYKNEKEEDIRYQIQIYGETKRCVTDYYLCENCIYINQETEYYSSQILEENFHDVLYRQTKDWVILGEEVYLLEDSGERKPDADYTFFSIDEVNDWVRE